MPLKAKIDGKDIISVLCSDEDWEEAQLASKGNIDRLRMNCCPAPAYASHSPLNLRFFAHKPGHERCASAGESDEHECLKAAAAKAVQSLEGWKSDVEVSGEGWRADVLAVRGAVKVAIEVQLSAQARRETGSRNDRFEASEVTAFWLKGQKNHFNDFGDGLQAPVVGKNIVEQSECARLAVTKMLRAIERQVEMANALARLIKSLPDWTYKIEKQGTVPACFELRRGDIRQQILLGELGPSLLPTVFRPEDGKQIGADQFAGAILQLRVEAPHLRGYQSSSFHIDKADISSSLEQRLRPVLRGEKRWQGQEHTEIVPGTFVHYDDKCSYCGSSFLRITQMLLGNPRHPRVMPPKIIADDWSWYKRVLPKAEALAERKKLRLGPLVGKEVFASISIVKAVQICPECRKLAPEKLISDDEALRLSPDREEHFRFRMPLPGKGWGVATAWLSRPKADTDAWDKLLAQRRQERSLAREEQRKREEFAEIERKRKQEKYRRLAEEQRLKRIADIEAQEAEERLWIEASKRNALEEQKELAARARAQREDKLAQTASQIIHDEVRCKLWLRTANPKLRCPKTRTAGRPIEMAAESKEGLERALTLLNSAKF
jgi:hypothetical protein